MAKRGEHWIARPKIYESPNQMYRAYIFNFQEDMWKYVYRNIYKDTIIERNVSIEVFNILKENRRFFLRHLNNTESNVIISNHLDYIEEALNNLLIMFGNKRGLFYRGVKRVHNEFAM
jgi:hypothetical protein